MGLVHMGGSEMQQNSTAQYMHVPLVEEFTKSKRLMSVNN